MNMLLHDVNFKAFQIENGDTLEDPAHKGEQFDAVVANPPYSANWSADPSFLKMNALATTGNSHRNRKQTLPLFNI